MKKIVITGCSGFVGSHLIDYLLINEPSLGIWGVDILQPEKKYAENIYFTQINLLAQDEFENILGHVSPDYIIHLASFSSVADSWRDPISCFKHNTNIFLNLLETMHVLRLRSRLLSIGSSEQYGIVPQDALPLSEQTPLRPSSPYAAARIAQEHLSLIYAKSFNLDIVCTRSFNHLGPGQPDKFVASSIARQFARVAKGLQKNISVGNVTIIRDFIDVRDVVRGYHFLLKKGVPGEVYNICSGTGIAIADLIELFRQISGINPEVSIDACLLRPVENPNVVGSFRKLQNDTAWKPEITLKDSLTEMYNFWLAD